MTASAPPLPTPTHRLFLLQRHEDPTGVSGVGQVAEGVEWSDGTVSLRWKGDDACTTFWDKGIASVEAVHGHGGMTEVLYFTPLPPGCPPPTPPLLRRRDRR